MNHFFCMKKNFLLGLCLWLCMLPELHAQLLWEISGNGLAKPSYLLGTMHSADPRVLAVGDKTLDKLYQCEVFAGELKMDQSMLMGLMGQLFMKGDTTLAKLLKPRQYSFVQKKMNERLGMMAPMAERMKPIFVMTLLQEAKDGQVPAMTAGKEPLDLYLQRKAEARKIESIGLETLGEQLNALNVIPLQTQAKELYKELKRNKKGGASEVVERMIGHYTKQDLQGLYKFAAGGMDERTNAAMLTTRNQQMTKRLLETMAKKTVFCAVGAAHLPGDDGLIALLRSQGYVLTPITL